MWTTFIAPPEYKVVDKHIFEVDFNNSDEEAQCQVGITYTTLRNI